MALILAFYLLITVLQSTLKLVWGDELFTFYIARTGSLMGIWQALQAGADPNPPLIHVSALLATHLFGTSALALRMPSILYVGVALISMWTILRRWLTPGFASVGLLAFMTTRGFDYSYDARSYAPMLGFSLLSLALWFASSNTVGSRRLLLAGMTISLAAGLASNYYCVLAFFPIAAAQFVLDLQRRRPDYPVWAALALGALPLLGFLPLIHHNIAEFAPHAWNRPHLSMITFSYLELVEGILWPILLLTLLCFYRRIPLALSASAKAALITLLLYPILGFLIAIGGAGMISPRCVTPVCCGFGLFGAVIASRLFPASRSALRAILMILVLWVVVREAFCASLLFQQRQAFLSLRDRTTQLAGSAPILVADSSLVLPLAFYSDPSVSQHMIFPMDFASIHRFEADDSGEQNLWAGRYGVFPFAIQPFAATSLPRNALVVARPDGWLARSLENAGGKLSATTPDPAWEHVGGVFSPMAHPETRFLLLTR